MLEEYIEIERGDECFDWQNFGFYRNIGRIFIEGLGGRGEGVEGWPARTAFVLLLYTLLEYEEGTAVSICCIIIYAFYLKLGAKAQRVCICCREPRSAVYATQPRALHVL